MARLEPQGDPVPLDPKAASRLIPLMGGGSMLPAAPGLCVTCATKHDAIHPHNATSLFYQFRFANQHGRAPTWADAIAHLSEAMRVVARDHIESVTEFTMPAAGVAPIAEPFAISEGL